MATSVIDYIFRDLAISYLKRADLGQVKPDDLLATGTKNDSGGKENGDDTKSAAKDSGAARSHGRAAAAEDKAAGVRPAADTVKSDIDNQILLARIKGYEGDPCPACGSFTLVRNGTCMKCDTCGGTTGCS
jgi:ribonucleoside-diphosphate reductase alpha chain